MNKPYHHEIAVSVEHLTVHYGQAPVLWEVTFAIPAGQTIGIIGPNGAGKSSLLKAMMGMVKPTSGNIAFFGSPLKTALARIAYIPQRTSVDWDFPICVLEVVLMGRYRKLGFLKWPKKKDKELAMEALKKVGMESFFNRHINQLSGGQQQRVFLARALLQEVDIYFMDEPFSGVDMATEKMIIALFHELKKEGKTLFIVHHDLATVSQYFDWIILLNTCLIASGLTQEVFNEENLKRAYGKGTVLLDETKKQLNR
ncbi:MAG: metal ABC transporter ATP-binding protein [Chlamydiae bacterium]|nr:metal ABC transporter ATP-binding protein [Chlamydiota bacterium]